MRVHHTAAVALSAVLLLTSCNGGGDDPPEAPSSTPSDTTSAAASPSVAPTEPTLPDAATRPTEAGARAFITYYWDLINYAQATGEVGPLVSASGPNCGGCGRGIDGIRDLYATGGHATGGEYTVAIDRLNRLGGARGKAAYEASVDVRNDEQLITRQDGSTEVLQSAQSRLAVAVLWVSRRWRLDVMEVQ